MRSLSTILVLLLLATGRPFAGAAGFLCEVKGKDCSANAVWGVKCCCETACDCDGSKDRTTAPTLAASHDNLRADFALVEMPAAAPTARVAELFKPLRVAAEWRTPHPRPRVAVTCIRLN